MTICVRHRGAFCGLGFMQNHVAIVDRKCISFENSGAELDKAVLNFPDLCLDRFARKDVSRKAHLGSNIYAATLMHENDSTFKA